MPQANFLPMLTGSFGAPAAENPTVAIVEAAYRHAGLPARYINCEVHPDDLDAAIAGAWGMGWRGFNCSLPHKVAVIAYLDELAESARLIGAVNCVVIGRDGKLTGYNTDGQGFIVSLRTVCDPAGKRVVVLGAGGAARAVAVESALAGAAHVTVMSRNPGPGQVVVDLVRAAGGSGDWGKWHPGEAIDPLAEILVNTTPVGMFPEVHAVPPIDYNSILPSMYVADLVSNPRQTQFLLRCAHMGATTLSGTYMLVNQAILGVEMWTGVRPDFAVMHDELVKVLS